MALGTVAREDRVFEVADRLAGGDRRFERDFRARAGVVGKHQREPVPADDFLARVARDLLDLGIDEQHAAVGREAHDHRVRGLDDLFGEGLRARQSGGGLAVAAVDREAPGDGVEQLALVFAEVAAVSGGYPATGRRQVPAQRAVDADRRLAGHRCGVESGAREHVSVDVDAHRRLFRVRAARRNQTADLAQRVRQRALDVLGRFEDGAQAGLLPGALGECAFQSREPCAPATAARPRQQQGAEQRDQRVEPGSRVGDSVRRGSGRARRGREGRRRPHDGRERTLVVVAGGVCVRRRQAREDRMYV